jgi:TRAP-type uncharacterized transport system fused permease subunit
MRVARTVLLACTPLAALAVPATASVAPSVDTGVDALQPDLGGRVLPTLIVKDRRGLLIRGAKVRIRPTFWQHTLVVGTQAAKLTDAAGRVTFTLRLRAAKFNQRRWLFTVETASTPSAQATRTTSVRLPRLTPTRRR